MIQKHWKIILMSILALILLNLIIVTPWEVTPFSSHSAGEIAWHETKDHLRYVLFLLPAIIGIWLIRKTMRLESYGKWILTNVLVSPFVFVGMGIALMIISSVIRGTGGDTEDLGSGFLFAGINVLIYFVSSIIERFRLKNAIDRETSNDVR